MNKIRLFLGKLLLKTIFKGTDYQMKIGEDWERGYVRFFNIIWYPKEGWVNSFHNFNQEDMKDLPKVLIDVFVNEMYGGPARYPYGMELQRVKKTLKRRKRKNEKPN